MREHCASTVGNMPESRPVLVEEKRSRMESLRCATRMILDNDNQYLTR